MSEVLDVGADAQQATELAKGDLNFLGMLCAPDTFTLLFPSFYITLFKLLTAFKARIERFAIGIPRGFAKTTFIKLLCVWYVLFSHKKFILIVGASEELAANTLADICDLLGSDNIVRLFGRWNRITEADNNTTKVIHFRGRDIILKAIGAGTAVRGINRKNSRPDVIIMDDIQKKEDSENADLSKALLKWILGTLSLARSNDGCTYIYVGNMYPQNCILEKLKKNSQWTSLIVGGLLSDGRSLWEELKPAEELIEEYQALLEMGEEEIFITEILNNTELAGISGIDPHKFPVVEPWELEYEAEGSFILIDPSSGKKKGDDCTIEHYSVRNAVPMFDQIKAGTFTPKETIVAAIQMGMENGTRLICVEDVAYQSTLLFWFNEYCETEGISGFIFAPTTPKGRNKNGRIKAGLIRILKGETKLHPAIRSLVVSQVTEWNPLKTDNVDDIIDPLGYVEEVMREYPEYIVKMVFDAEDEVSVAAHTSTLALPF